MNYFVTAIGTDSGKTVVSAILVEYLAADYWKPIQCGEPRDTAAVMALTDMDESRFYSERHFLKMPASPHAAAKAENIQLSIEDFHQPVSNRPLVIEGAGGMLVPINDEHYLIDMAQRMECAVILVCNLYLGSINHSLLSMSELIRREVAVSGIIFNGPSDPDSEDIIMKKSPWPCLLKVAQHEQISPKVVREYAVKLQSQWGENFSKLSNQSASLL